MEKRIPVMMSVFTALVLLAAPSPTVSAAGRGQPRREPAFRACVHSEPAGPQVASLHHVSFRTACGITEKIVSHVWPESDWTSVGKYCINRLGRVREFDDWNVKSPNHGVARMSRGGSWFAFRGQEFPIGCV